IENAGLAPEARRALLGRADVAEQPLEHALRVDLGRQGRRRRLPGQRVEINAAPAELARVRCALDALDAELERAQRRALPDGVGDVLVDGLAGPHVRALRLPRGPAAEPERPD